MLLSLVLCVAAFFTGTTSQKTKVDVELFYESLCPDSHNFITQQLYPIWKDVQPFVNLKFIPFGKSVSINNGENFVCQHGPRECMGNRIQSCVLALIRDQNAKVEFVNCFMQRFKKKAFQQYEFGQSCVAAIGLNWADVANCYNSQEGRDLQLQAELETAKVAPKFIPTVIYEKQFNQLAQDDSLQDFKAVLCSYISQISPQACKSQVPQPFRIIV